MTGLHFSLFLTVFTVLFQVSLGLRTLNRANLPTKISAFDTKNNEIQNDSPLVSHDPNDVHFYLYSSGSDPESRKEIKYNDTESLTQSSFQIGVKTVIMIHGFNSNPDSHFPKLVKDAYLKSEIVSNYMVVDWSLLGTYNGTDPAAALAAYPEVVIFSIPIVAKRVSEFVKFLQNLSYIDLNLIHIIGHSLGAHVSGYAGKHIQNLNGGEKVARISGLDPAGPLFDVPVQRKIRKEDGNFVDIIHTAMGSRGDLSVNGHVDFYPNGGASQPGCWEKDHENPAFLGTCSHQFVANIFAATISKNFTACQCTPFYPVLNMCLGDCPTKVLAGEPCRVDAKGQYYFTTSSNPADD